MTAVIEREPVTTTRTAGVFGGKSMALLASEVRLMVGRPRNIVGYSTLMLVPVLLGVGVYFSDPTAGGDGPPLMANMFGNGLILPIAALMLSMQLLLPMATSMIAADALAAEANQGTLRGLLLAPVSRTRLVWLKAAGMAIGVFMAVAGTALVGLVTGLILIGGDRLTTLSGTTLSLGEGLGRIGLAVLFVTFQMVALGAIGLAISASTDTPLVVTAVTMGLVITFGVLSVISSLDWLAPLFLTSGWGSAVLGLVQDPINFEPIITGLLKSTCYLVIGLSIAHLRLATREG